MSSRHFGEMMRAQWKAGKFVCVGLDPVWEKIPKSLQGLDHSPSVLATFALSVVAAVADTAGFLKFNLAFWLSQGAAGLEALHVALTEVRHRHSHLPIILDGKFGDIDRSSAGYASLTFDWLKADAVTVNPYLGGEALQPFLSRSDKGVFVLCRTSNEGSEEFQTRETQTCQSQTTGRIYHRPLYQVVALGVRDRWGPGCGLVAGATYTDELAEIRKIAPNLPLLIPGIGTQGGDLKATILAGRDGQRQGMIINSSSSIIHASTGDDFATAAQAKTLELHMAITECLASA